MSSLLHKIKVLMEKNEYLSRAIPYLLETKFVRYRAQFPNSIEYRNKAIRRANETREEFQTCYEAHRDEFVQLAEMLEDDFSRKTLQTVIKYRLTPNPDRRILRPVIAKPQYFLRDIVKPVANEVFVDGGGYIGDTLLDLATFWGRKWKKVYSWEPDEINRAKLRETCRTQKYQNIEIVPCGLWRERAELHFNQQGKDWSMISENGSAVVIVDSIDNVCGKDRVTFIKMDIEGSEVEALRGAEKTICRDKPRLAISIYHKPEDYFEIPFLIKEMVPEYKLYIRHHAFNKNNTVVYAVL